MSNALAIASVTAVLRNLLDNGLIDDAVTGTVGHVNVTALAPDLISLVSNAESQLNLFLYMVTPNAAWRNEGLPSRDDEGARRTNPPLALDLRYLLTAYASRDLHAEVLLGYGMQLLHETPVLSRAGIRRALAVPGLIDDSGGLPSELEALATSALAEQAEMIKITPDAVGPEELSRLWSAFQSRYRPTAFYRVSVVLIYSDRSTRSPLPVRNRRVYVVPFREPVIKTVLGQDAPAGAMVTRPILARHRLVLRGRGLRGDAMTVRVSGVEVTPSPADISDTEVRVTLPAELNAGIQSAQVLHAHDMGEPPTPHVGVYSNLAPFVLHPEIIPPVVASPGTIRVSVEPPVQERQRVVLLLNERIVPASLQVAVRPRAYSFVAPASITSPGGPVREIDVPYAGVTPGEYLVRVTVDGAESPLDVDPSGAYVAPAVVLS